MSKAAPAPGQAKPKPIGDLPPEPTNEAEPAEQSATRFVGVWIGLPLLFLRIALVVRVKCGAAP